MSFFVLSERQKNGRSSSVYIHGVINTGCLGIDWKILCYTAFRWTFTPILPSDSGRILCWCNVYFATKISPSRSLMSVTRSQIYLADGKISLTRSTDVVGYLMKCVCPCGAAGQLCKTEKKMKALKWWQRSGMDGVRRRGDSSRSVKCVGWWAGGMLGKRQRAGEADAPSWQAVWLVVTRWQKVRRVSNVVLRAFVGIFSASTVSPVGLVSCLSALSKHIWCMSAFLSSIYQPSSDGAHAGNKPFSIGSLLHSISF